MEVRNERLKDLSTCGSVRFGTCTALHLRTVSWALSQQAHSYQGLTWGRRSAFVMQNSARGELSLPSIHYI